MPFSSTPFTFAIVLAVVASGRAPAAEPVDLIVNGGFEDGLAGWTPDPKHSVVTGPSEAHSGKACLTGEVTRPKQALFLVQQVAVKCGNRYQFEIWARGTNRTKLVLWATQPGEKNRRMIASWPRLTPRWRRYSVPLPVVADGQLTLQIIAPSSHGEPPGRIWVDDIAVHETAMPPIASISQQTGFNDEPAMCRTDDGLIYTAWISFRDKADSLQVACTSIEGKAFKPVGAWQVLGGKGTYVLGVTVLGAGNRACVLYAAESEENWDIYAVFCDTDGPDEPIRVTSTDSVDIKPAAAWHDGTLWIAWESNRGSRRQIVVTSVRDRKVAPPKQISLGEASCYAPSIDVLESGVVCVAWHSFRENNYDIYLRRQALSDAWQPEERLTKAPTIDRHAILFHRDDELWLIYENAQVATYHVGSTNQRQLVVARVTPRGLLAPQTGRGRSPLAARCEAPSVAFDISGRLWVAYLRPRLPRAGWDVYLTRLVGSRWEPPLPVSFRKGMDRRPSLVLDAGRAIVAFQSDTIPNSWSDLDKTEAAASDIFLATVDPGPAPANTAMTFAPLVENGEPFEPGEIRIARGEDTPTSSIEYRGQTLKLYYGDLHEHTDVSVCNRVGDQSVDESYQHMRDLARHDFACATDHGYNFNPYLWGYMAKLARVNDDPGRFLTFLAEEWTSSFEKYSEEHPYGYYGHRNLILADTYFPRWWNSRNGQTPAGMWEDLRKLNANFVNIPHQLADTGNVPTDWSYADEKAQPVAEIFQTRGSYEYKGTPREARRSTPRAGYFLQDAWARGIVIGVIASPDHGGGYGKACVFAPELTREAILDAIRARHCYGTTAAKIFLDVRVDDHLMGEKVATPAGRSVKVKITVRCPRDIRQIEVCRNNRFIYTTNPKGRKAEVTFIDREPLAGRSYYYVRVIQQDEEIAWSSPVWFGAK